MFTIFIAKSNIVESITFDFNVVIVSTKSIELKNNVKIIFATIKIAFVVAIVVANIKLKNNLKIVSIATIVAIDNLKKQAIKKKIVIKKNNNKKIVEKKIVVIAIIFQKTILINIGNSGISAQKVHVANAANLTIS